MLKTFLFYLEANENYWYEYLYVGTIHITWYNCNTNNIPPYNSCYVVKSINKIYTK